MDKRTKKRTNEEHDTVKRTHVWAATAWPAMLNTSNTPDRSPTVWIHLLQSMNCQHTFRSSSSQVNFLSHFPFQEKLKRVCCLPFVAIFKFCSTDVIWLLELQKKSTLCSAIDQFQWMTWQKNNLLFYVWDFQSPSHLAFPNKSTHCAFHLPSALSSAQWRDAVGSTESFPQKRHTAKAFKIGRYRSEMLDPAELRLHRQVQRMLCWEQTLFPKKCHLCVCVASIGHGLSLCQMLGLLQKAAPPINE